MIRNLGLISEMGPRLSFCDIIESDIKESTVYENCIYGNSRLCKVGP